MTTLQQFKLAGWSEVNSQGIPTLYLAAVDEGMTTSPSDTPANTDFYPMIAHPEQFSIKRAPVMWAEGSTSGQAAAFGQIQLNNYEGEFDNLLLADLRDTLVVIKILPAGMLLTGTAMRDAMTVATGIIDTISATDEDVVIINIKDTIARLDKTLPVRINPSFVASGAANVMVPLTFGACRNVVPLLVDSANRLFQIHDSVIPNIVLAADMAAPLDPNASPPQYTPALSGSGIQPETMPQGKFTVDCSSYGTQAVIPGVNDILSGAGAFPGTQGASAWLGGIAGYATTVAAGGVTGSGSTRTVHTTANAPATGKKLYTTDGTNSLYGTISSGGGTTSPVVGTLTIVGTANSIAAGSPVIIPGAPDGFTWSGTTAPTEQTNPPNTWIPGTGNAVALGTDVAYNPSSSGGGPTFGGVFEVKAAQLAAGQTYRVTFALNQVTVSPPSLSNGRPGGVILTTKLSVNPSDYITGMLTPLTSPLYSDQAYSFEFSIPVGSAPRNLYFILAPASGSTIGSANGGCTAIIADLKIELVGQFVEQPIVSMPLDNYYTEILVNRAGEDPSIFNAMEAAALYQRADGTLIPFGVHFDNPPNILDALRIPVNSKGGVIFTDSVGTIRTRQLVNPSDPANLGTIKAAFTPDNIMRPISIDEDQATALTTLVGARRNCSVFTSSDFVTDQALVPQDEKTRYSRTSQFWINSTNVPASQYSFAISAPIFDTVLDLPSDAQDEIDRVVGIWSPQIFTDGTFTTGKRRLVTFTAFFDDPAAVGIGTTAALTDLQYGDIISFDYPRHGFNNVLAVIVAWELFPFAQKIILTVMV